MEKIESQIMPAPPNTIASLRAGFDAVANHIMVITIPLVLDLLLWLGPHVQVKALSSKFFDLLSSNTAFPTSQPDVSFSAGVDLLRTFFSNFNLLSLMRTIPVGIPSLMAFKLPVTVPSGAPSFIDVNSPVFFTLVIAGLLLVGLVGGSLFYTLIIQAALYGKIEIKRAFTSWVWSSIQVVSLALALLLLFIIVSVPASCIIFVLAIFGIPLGQFSFFLYFAFLLWLAFPLIFSAHGIFVNRNNALTSVQRSMAMTRMTLPTTSLFLLSILAISEGLDILWRVPPDNSWLTLIGVSGHAFVASALLAASFIYYRDADTYTQETLKILKARQQVPLQGN